MDYLVKVLEMDFFGGRIALLRTWGGGMVAEDRSVRTDVGKAFLIIEI